MNLRPQTTSPTRRPRASRAAAAAVMATAVLIALPAGAVFAATGVPMGRSTSGAVVSAPVGWLRVAHLAPKVGPMDAYLTPRTGLAVVLHHVGYGTFSAYQTLKPGSFTLAMRPAGAAASTAPITSYAVTVRAGTASTIAALGSPGHLRTELFNDALVRPPTGSARVRLIQGAPAATQVSVTAVDGPLLASDVPYGSVTGYANVPQGRWTLEVTEDGMNVSTVVDVAAGGVYSLVVVQTADGGLTLNTGVDVSGKPKAAVGKGSAPLSMSIHNDAADSTSAPKGSVNTGEGGTAPDGTRGSSGVGYRGATFAGLSSLVLAGAFVWRRRATLRR